MEKRNQPMSSPPFEQPNQAQPSPVQTAKLKKNGDGNSARSPRGSNAETPDAARQRRPDAADDDDDARQNSL
jgi:hypothetical protein